MYKWHQENKKIHTPKKKHIMFPPLLLQFWGLKVYWMGPMGQKSHPHRTPKSSQVTVKETPTASAVFWGVMVHQWPMGMIMGRFTNLWMLRLHVGPNKYV